MSKRSHGEGSISHRSNGTWLAQVSIEGKRISHTFKLRKDAQEWLTNTTNQVKQGLTYSSSKTKVDELLTAWLELKSANTRLATQEQYRRLSRLYISPFMGGIKMQDISSAKILRFYSELGIKGTGKRTIELVHTILHGFLDYANRQGLIAQNWAALVEVPHRKNPRCLYGTRVR